MPIEKISTIDDQRLDPFARLTDLQLRSRIEPSKGVFIAETAEVIRRALDGGATPLSLLTEERYLYQLQDVIEKTEAANPEANIFLAPSEELEKITGFHLNRGALCAFRRPHELTVEQAVDGAGLVAILEDIRDFTNVGALFRSAAAIGVDAVLVSPACYDPLYRRALRVSMGTVFQVPWARLGGDVHDWAATGIDHLHSLGFKTAAMALSDESIPLDSPQLLEADRLALVFGTEGDGLAQSTISRCDWTVRIPMKHGVDSLNVAASSAVAFWQLRSLIRKS